MAALKANLENYGLFDAMYDILECHKKGAIKAARDLGYSKEAIKAIGECNAVEDIEEIMAYERSRI